jgi:TatD DNase family protein
LSVGFHVMKWWDSHCHAIDASSSLISGGLVVTTHPSDWSLIPSLETLSSWQFAIGLHPWFADESVDWSYVASMLETHPMLSIGEIGLDGVGRDIQMQVAVFERQCRLAVHYDRVVSLHLVKDAGVGLSILKTLQVQRAVVHGFLGSREQASAYQAMGYYLGLGPRLFHGTSEKRIHMLEHLDKRLVLLESDSPSTFNVGSNSIITVATQLSDIWGVTIEDVSEMCDHNWCRLWRK